jgi:hypothetical protein
MYCRSFVTHENFFVNDGGKTYKRYEYGTK